MALALTVSSIDGLDDSIKSLYVEKDGGFNLDVSGLPDVTGLKGKNTELLDELKEFKRKAKEQADLAKEKSDELEAQRLEQLSKGNDLEAYKKSVEEKHARELKAATDREELYKGIAIDQGSGQAATKLAAELALNINGVSTSRHLVPQFAQRLRTDFIEGKAVITVLDKDGKPSAATQEELRDEIRNLPTNSMLVSGSKGKGSGIPGNNGHNGQQGIDVSKMSPKQKIEYGREQQA